MYSSAGRLPLGRVDTHPSLLRVLAPCALVSLCECAGAGGCLALVKMTPASAAFLPLTTKLWVVMMQPSPGYRERMPRAHIAMDKTGWAEYVPLLLPQSPTNHHQKLLAMHMRMLATFFREFK